MANSKTICIFSALFPPSIGGVENYSFNLAKELINCGNRVLVVTNNTHRQKSHQVMDNGIEIYRLPCVSILNGRLPLPRINAEFRKSIIEIESHPIDNILINTRFYPHTILGLRTAVRKKTIPIILEHGSNYLTLGNAILDSAIRTYEHLITAYIRKYPAQYYGVSKKACQWLGTYGLSAAGVIPNAIDPKSLDIAAKSPSARKKFTVVFIGRLVPEKGIKQLIAAADLLKEYTDIEFMIIGSGPLMQWIKANKGRNVTILGALPHERTLELLSQGDALCLPSRSEGFSTILLESAALGITPITTNVGGVDELIPDNTYGIILEDSMPSSIAEAVHHIYKNPTLKNAIGKRLQKRTLEEFTWNRTARRLLEAFSANL